MRPVDILWIEDNHTEIAFIKQAMKSIAIPYNINFVYDGIMALDFLKHQGAFRNKPNPDLIMLDLNMPRKNGFELLKEINANEKLNKLPVVVFSSLKEESLKEHNLHTYFISKPFGVEEFDKVVNYIESFWLKELQIPQQYNTERPNQI